MSNKFRKVLVCFVLLALTSKGAWAVPLVSVEPSSMSVGPGDTFSLSVFVAGITDLYAYQFDISFDSNLLSAQNITEGPFLASGGATFFVPGLIDNLSGLISFTANSLLGPDPGVTGSGVLAQVEFVALGTGISHVDLSGVLLLDSTLADITAQVAAGTVEVQDNSGSIPEPTTAFMLVLGIGLLGASRRRYSRGGRSSIKKR